MKTIHILSLAAATCVLSTAMGADEASPFKDQKDRVSYSIGMSIGSSLKAQQADVDPDVIARGIKDTLAGKPLLTDEQMRNAIQAWRNDVQNKRSEQLKSQGEKNKKEADAFLAENAKKDGVMTMTNGLQYRILASGTGKSPSSNDIVRAHYRGTLIDGTEFDSSYTRGQPFVAPANRVIPGWTIALTHMKVGDKWQLFVPPGLAYGERGMPPKIGPNSALIFEMELIGFDAPQASPSVPPTPGELKATPAPK